MISKIKNYFRRIHYPQQAQKDHSEPVRLRNHLRKQKKIKLFTSHYLHILRIAPDFYHAWFADGEKSGRRRIKIIKSLSPKNIIKDIKLLLKTPKRRNKAIALALSFSIIIAIIVPYLPSDLIYRLFPGAKLAQAGWYDDNWAYRQKVTIENSGSVDADKKVLVDFDTSTLVTEGKLQSDLDDLRVTDKNGKILPYYIDTIGGGTPSQDTEGSSVRSATVNTKIDDAGAGTMPATGRQIVQTSGGTLYAFVNDGGSCEIWKSENGSSWSEQDSSHNPSDCDTAEKTIAMAIDSTDKLHLLYKTNVNQIKYTTFDTTDNLFLLTSDTIETNVGGSAANSLDIALDSNDKPQVVWVDANAVDNPSGVNYSNKVSGSWNDTNITGDIPESVSIIINEDNIPEVSYIYDPLNYLVAAVGNLNNATSFGTPYIVDSTINITSGQMGSSIGVDENGNTWIAYINATTNYVALAKHNDADAWTIWTNSISNSQNNVGSEPSLSIIGKTIFFLKDDLHAQALLTAFEQHDPFRGVSIKLPNMLRLIFDGALYKNPTSNANRNFIEHLVRHQAGVPGQFNADDMLIHFTNDMQDIVKAGGINQDQYPYLNLNKALIAFGLQAY